MLGCIIVAVVLFIIAGIGHWRTPEWHYNSVLISWGLAFLALAIGWPAIVAAFTR
jgi:hypothetical protein